MPSILTNPKMRKMLLVVVALGVLVILSQVMFKAAPPNPIKQKQKAEVEHELFAPDAVQQMDETRLKSVFDSVQTELQDREKEVTSQQQENERFRARMESQMESLQTRVKSLSNERDMLREQLTRPHQESLPIGEIGRPKNGRIQSQVPQNNSPQADPFSTVLDSTLSTFSGGSSPRQRGSSQNSSSTTASIKMRKIHGNEVEMAEIDSATGVRKVGAKSDSKSKNDKAEKGAWLPAGSIISGLLITGLDAPTSPGADPIPTVLRVKGEAILPNLFTMDLSECFIFGESTGDLSSERAKVRAQVLSCVREDGKAIEVGIMATGAGSDGKMGVRGRVVTKNGQLIAQSLLAGMASGLTDSLTPSVIPTLQTSPDGSNSQTQRNRLADVKEASAFSGASNAMDRIAQYMMDIAEGIHPVLEIDAGRTVDFVLQRGLSLQIK